jgi:hypothetical protein
MPAGPPPAAASPSAAGPAPPGRRAPRRAGATGMRPTRGLSPADRDSGRARLPVSGGPTPADFAAGGQRAASSSTGGGGSSGAREKPSDGGASRHALRRSGGRCVLRGQLGRGASRQSALGMHVLRAGYTAEDAPCCLLPPSSCLLRAPPPGPT